MGKLFYGALPGIHGYAKNLRKNLTPTENILWSRLSGKKLGVKFRRQHPLNCYVVDFYCHEVGLIIEIDGEVHLDKKNQKSDRIREKKFHSYNLQVIRFSNKEIYENVEEVIGRIRTVLEERRNHP